MISIYLFIGLLASILGALPLGASNIAVINTTIKKDTNEAFKIIITAGIAEILLAFYALHCFYSVQAFVTSNMWIEFLIASIIFLVGIFLVLKRRKNKSVKKFNFKISKYTLGFLVGILNPPVIIYWILALGIINSSSYALSIQSSYGIILLFFFGIYLGKTITLLTYSKLSHYLKNKSETISLTVNRITGILLMVVGLFQITKSYFI